MGSSLLDSLNQGYVVAGSITATAGTAAALTCNDGSATLTRSTDGDYTVTFGQTFLSAPVVVASPVDATFATTAFHTVTVQAVATNSVQFNIVTKGTGTTNALGDNANIAFMAFGKRNK